MIDKHLYPHEEWSVKGKFPGKTVMNKLKTVDFDGQKYAYKIFSHKCGEYGVSTCYSTRFYKIEPKSKQFGKYTIPVLGYLIQFGEKVIRTYHEYLFTINRSVESLSLTKMEIRGLIKRQVDLIERREEIKNGQIL